MRERKIIPIREAARRAVEKGAPVSNRRRRSPAQELATQMRAESARVERKDFGEKTPRLDEARPAKPDLTQEEMHRKFFMPEAQEQVSQPCGSLTGYSIMEEIVEDMYQGTLRPFVEGEPIGALRDATRGPATPLKTRDDIMDDRQKQLRARQRSNDRQLARLIERNA